MSITEVLIALISISVAVLIVCTWPFTKKWLNNYWFFAFIALFAFIYYVVGRVSYEWKNFIDDPEKSINISKALLLDLCPFFAFFIPLALIIDPSRKVASVFAPVSLFGAILTIGSGFPGGIPPTDLVHYIFLGEGENKMFFMMHFLNLIVATLVMLGTPKFNVKGALYTNISILLYFTYVAIIVLALDVESNASGLLLFDWSDGEYFLIGYILDLSAAEAAALGLFLCWLFTILFILFFDFIKKYKPYNQDNLKYSFCQKYNGLKK